MTLLTPRARTNSNSCQTTVNDDNLNHDTRMQDPKPNTKDVDDTNMKVSRGSLAGNLISGILKTTGIVLGEILPPTLTLTQKHVLPELFQTFNALYADKIPIRVQEWIDVCLHGINHFLEVNFTTEKGKKLQTKLHGILDDFLEASTTDKSRQLLVETVAAVVKTGQVFKTPETKELLDHCAIFVCRLVDALSTPSAKHLYHDIAQFIWTAIELMADSETTNAIAQVTAHLCHKLEMEHILHQPISRQNMSKKAKAEERRERAQFHKHIFLDKKVFNDGTGKQEDIEDVLNKAFNINKNKMEEEDKEHHEAFSAKSNQGDAISSVESFKDIPPKNVSIKFNEEGADDDAVSLPLSSSIITVSPSIYFHGDYNHEENEEWIEMKNKRIEESSTPPKFSINTDAAINDHHELNTEKIGDVDNMDIEDIWRPKEDNPKSVRSASSLNRSVYNKIKDNLEVRPIRYEEEEVQTAVKDEIDSCATDYNSTVQTSLHSMLQNLERKEKPPMHNSPSTPNHNIPQRNSNMQAESQYYKALEDATNAHRIATVQAILNDPHFRSENGTKKWFPAAAAAAGAGNEMGQEIFEQYISSLKKNSKARANIGVGVGNHAESKTHSKILSFMLSRKALYILLICLILFMCFIWFALGVYGLYMIFHSHQNVIAATQHPPPVMTVRIIREVIVRKETDVASFVADHFVDDRVLIQNWTELQDDTQHLEDTDIISTDWGLNIGMDQVATPKTTKNKNINGENEFHRIDKDRSPNTAEKKNSAIEL